MDHAHLIPDAPAPDTAARSSAQSPDNARWTGARASAFLRLLARSGKVEPCARAVGMSRQSAYRLRARAPLFAQYWDMAMDEAEARRASARRVRGLRGGRAVHPLLARNPQAGFGPDTGDSPAPFA